MENLIPAANLLAFIFGAGALWQKVKDLDKRLERIEDFLNGGLKKRKEL